MTLELDPIVTLPLVPLTLIVDPVNQDRRARLDVGDRRGHPHVVDDSPEGALYV